MVVGMPASAPSPVRDSDGKVKLGADVEEKDLELWKMVSITGAWIGIQMLWGTEFSVTQPYMESLGMSPGLASLTWIWGPITGFVVAPIIGAASDRCESKYGRRRPFILTGLILMTVCAFLFASAGKIFSGTAAQVFALIMFIGMDASINVLQTPIRVFVSDLCSSSQQTTGQLLSVGFQGIGGLLASAVMLPFQDKAANVFPVIAIALAVNFILLGFACFVGKEEQYKRPAYLPAQSVLEPFKTVFGAVRYMPNSLIRVAVVQFFSWYALFCMWTFSSTWWGKVVYQGCNTDTSCTGSGHDAYNNGTQSNDRYNIVANGIQVIVSVLLAYLMAAKILKRVKFIYSACLAVGAVLFYINYSGADGKPSLAAVTMSLVSIPICAINSFPFALIGSDTRANTDKEYDTGVQFGVLNLFIVVPQIIVTVIQSSLQASGNERYNFLMVAISWTIAAVAALFVNDQNVNDADVNLVRQSMQSAASNRAPKEQV